MGYVVSVAISVFAISWTKLRIKSASRRLAGGDCQLIHSVDVDSTAVYAIGASNSQCRFACILDLTCIALPCILLCMLLEAVGGWPPHVIQPRCWLRHLQSEECCQHHRYSHFDLFRHVLKTPASVESRSSSLRK